MIAYDSVSGGIKHYRVDKIRDITVTNIPRDGQEKLANFDAARYTKKLFGMYAGKETHVTLECENRMVGVLIDRFGKDIPILKKNDSHFISTVDVAVSEQFLGWIMSLGDGVKIIAPDEVVQQMKRLIQRLADQYSDKENLI